MFGETRESASCVGNRVSPHLFWSHPRPSIHRPAGRLRSAGRDARDDLVERSRVGEVDVAKKVAEAEEVRVRVHHARDDGMPGEVEHLGGGSAKEQRFAHRADELDLAVAHRHRRDEGMAIVDGVDPGVGDDEIGRGGAGAR